MKLRKKALAVLLLTGTVLASLTGCGASGSSVQDTGLFKEMDTKDLEGNALDSSVFAENKLTLVNVWNLGCTPCIQEIPVLDQLNKEYEGNGVAIMGMYHNFGTDISEEDKAAIDEILSDAGAEYTQFVPSQSMYESDTMKSIQAFPTTYFVDSEGNIVEKIEGSADYEGWKERIEKVLEKVEE